MDASKLCTSHAALIAHTSTPPHITSPLYPYLTLTSLRVSSSSTPITTNSSHATLSVRDDHKPLQPLQEPTAVSLSLPSSRHRRQLASPMWRDRLLHSLLLVVLLCMHLSSRACYAEQDGDRHREQQPPCLSTDGRAAAQGEEEREAQNRIRNAMQREVQRAEAARERMEHERHAQPANNASSATALCPLLYYTPQLWRDQRAPDRYTLRLAHVTPTLSALTHIAFVDVHYALVDSRSLNVRGLSHTARVAADVAAASVGKLELQRLEVHKGQALRVFVVYCVDGRECNDAPTVLFVD